MSRKSIVVNREALRTQSHISMGFITDLLTRKSLRRMKNVPLRNSEDKGKFFCDLSHLILRSTRALQRKIDEVLADNEENIQMVRVNHQIILTNAVTCI